MRRCGMRLAHKYSNRSRASNNPEVPSGNAPSASLLQPTADFLRLVDPLPQALSNHPMRQVGRPINFIPYIWQPTLLWDVTEWLKERIKLDFV